MAELPGFIQNWYQIPQMFLGGIRKVQLKNNLKFIINDHMNLLQLLEIIKNDDYRLNKHNNIKTIIDIGGNIGDFTVYAANKFSKANVYVFEPDPKTFEILQKNVKLNSLKNVFAYKLGVSDKSGKKSFYSYNFSGLSGFSKLDNKKSIKKTIDTVSFNKLFEKINIRNCDFLKVDCEGAEFDIFLNLDSKIYKKIKNMAVEYHDGLTDYNHSDLVKRFKKEGYRIVIKKHPIEKNIGIIYARQ
jgi:FkbM family methyltransferase